MTLLVPDAGEALALKNFLNNTAPQDQVLKLFTNNITPSETDVAGTYTEATGGGYAAKTLLGSNWTFTPGAPSSASYGTTQTWTFTGALAGNPTVYGYYVVQSSGTLMWAEAEPAFTPVNNGDNIVMTPTITAD